MSPRVRARVKEPRVFGNVKAGSFWVEYPSGLIDITHSGPPKAGEQDAPPKHDGHFEFSVEGDRCIRIDPKQSAIVIVDMQNFFLSPELFEHPQGLACVDPLLALVPFLRKAGVRVIWLNWGLTPAEVTALPPALARSFTSHWPGGFGADLGAGWGALLMRGAHNADLYGPLHEEWLRGKASGTDVWIHKNRMGGMWGAGTAFEMYLKEEGIKTLLFAGVNTDQCVLGTILDAYLGGFDVVVVKDTTATTSPAVGFSNLVYNTEQSYGFVTGSEHILQAM